MFASWKLFVAGKMWVVELIWRCAEEGGAIFED